MALASWEPSLAFSRVLDEKDRMIDVQVDLYTTEVEAMKGFREILSVEVPDQKAQADHADQAEAALNRVAQNRVTPDQKVDVLTVPQAGRMADR